MTTSSEHVEREAELRRRRDSGEITQAEYQQAFTEGRSQMSLEEVQAMNRENVNFGVEGEIPEPKTPTDPVDNSRQRAFNSGDFMGEIGFFDLLERGPNALNAFADNSSLFDTVTNLNRSSAGFQGFGKGIMSKG